MFQCGKARCKICQFIEPGLTFCSFVEKHTFCINYHFDCDSQGVIYRQQKNFLFKATILQLGCQVQMKCFNNAIQILYIVPKTRTEMRYSLLNI